MDELLGTLLWVKLELVVRLRVPERRDSIFTRVTQGFDWHWVRATIFMLSFPPMLGTGPGGRRWTRPRHLEEIKSAIELFVFMKRDKKSDCLTLDDLFEIPTSSTPSSCTMRTKPPIPPIPGLDSELARSGGTDCDH